MGFSLFEEVDRRGHEQVVVFNHPEVGLKALIGVHSTVLGPGLGGCRLRLYDDEASALDDVLRLSEGMTYKNALAEMPLGGGKACIIVDPHFEENRRELFVQFGKCVDSLGGRYITAEDMGTTPEDVEWIHESTNYATGRAPEKGGSGDPSPWTALGVYQSMRAAAEKIYGDASLAGKRVTVQGVGHVGRYLIEHLVKEKAEVIVCDTYEPSLKEVANDFPVETVPVDALYDVDCDIYAPCAIGQTVNKDTIPRLQCKIIAGAANNQLQDESVYSALEEKGIVYLPDFAINSGGVISVGAELNDGGWKEPWVTDKVMKIYQTTQLIMEESEKRKLFPEVVAVELAKERIQAAK